MPSAVIATAKLSGVDLKTVRETLRYVLSDTQNEESLNGVTSALNKAIEEIDLALAADATPSAPVSNSSKLQLDRFSSNRILFLPRPRCRNNRTTQPITGVPSSLDVGGTKKTSSLHRNFAALQEAITYYVQKLRA